MTRIAVGAGALLMVVLVLGGLLVLLLLAGRVNTPTLETHFRLSRIISIIEDSVVVSFRTEFSRSYVDARHRETLQEVLSQALGRPITLTLTVQGK